jgi:DNA polymerase III subunit delta
MILFLYGKDTFRSRNQLHKMIEKFRADRDPQGLNVTRLDCEKMDPAAIWDQLLAAPFLAEKRMVVLENVLLSKKYEFHKALLTRIEEKTLPDSNIIMFWDGLDTVKKKEVKALFVRLAEEKYAQRFDILSDIKREGWIAAEVEQRGGKIERNALRYFLQNVEDDMWYLNTLIDQLVCYSSGKEISSETVRLFVSEKVDDNIFNLVDAIIAKQPKKVFVMMQEQYRQGKDVQYVYAMVLRQFRILLELRDMFDREEALQSTVLAKKLGLHPFVVKKSLPLVKQYTISVLEEIYRHLLELDIQIKTGKGDQRVLMDIFVGGVCLV